MQHSERAYDTEPYRQALAEVLRSMEDRRISSGDLVFSDHHLGAGGFGEVIQGSWYRIGEAGEVKTLPVAIKILQPKQHAFIRLVLRFARELKLWATFEHPNVLACLGFHIDPDYNEAWFVSPYLAGGNIHSRVNTDTTITFEQRLKWVVDMTQGLAYLHSMTPPVAHGDLKSENILLDDQDSAVICDFGLSTVVEDSITTGLTTSDAWKGSVLWCSPELLDNEKRTTHSDIWAWALCVLEITTGRLPFYSARNEIAIYSRILGQCPTRDEYPELPSDNSLWVMLEKCFLKNPLERPSTNDCLVEVSRSILSSTSGGSWEERENYVNDGRVLPAALDSPEPTLPTSPDELGSTISSTSPVISRARTLFRTQVQKVLNRPAKSPSPFVPATPRRSSTIFTAPEGQRSNQEGFTLHPSSLAIVIPKLKKLQPTQYLREHSGLVRHLQFSPDGKWLATCSQDRTAIIWKVGEPFQPHKILAHPGAGFISQVAWSPDGKYLLTKMHKAVKVWMTDTGVLFKTINRSYHVDVVAWLPSGKAFASVEHDHIDIVDIEGNTMNTYVFRHMQIHNIAFMPDEERILLVGILESSKKGLQPKKSRAEKRILLYNVTDKKIDNQVPVLQNVRDVSIASDGSLALVSYEDLAPPEGWAIDLLNNGTRLRLLNTYMPTAPVDFAGPSYFGGIKDQFVICAGKKGDIHIWDRKTGLLLHSLQDANVVDGGMEDLTGIAWNHHAPSQYMFASATHDGTVRIWTAQAPSETGPS